jgi:hypothetical protein
MEWVEYCYTDFGVLYDVWWWTILLGFVFVFVWTSRNSYIVYRNRRASPNKSMLEPNVVIMHGNFVACVFRFLFLINCYNGRSPGGAIVHSIEDFLVTIPQIIILSEYLIMSVVWGSIIEMTKTMRSINRKQSTNGVSDEGNRRLVYVTVFAITLFAMLMVLQILPLFVPSLSYMADVVNLVKLGGCFPSIIVAVITVSKLSKLLTTIGGGQQAKNASQSQLNAKAKREAMIKQIRTSVFLSASASIVAIAATVLGLTTILKTPYPRRLIFWTIIHLFEATCIVLISNSISYKDRKFGSTSLRSAINVPSSSAGARDSSLRDTGRESNFRSGNVVTLRGEGGIPRSSSKARRGNSGVAGTTTSKANSIHPIPGELELSKQSNASCLESVHGAEKALQ